VSSPASCADRSWSATPPTAVPRRAHWCRVSWCSFRRGCAPRPKFSNWKTSMSRGAQRQRLVDAVTDALLDLGPVDVSLRSLATAAGTSHALLRYHFGTKDALL